MTIQRRSDSKCVASLRLLARRIIRPNPETGLSEVYDRPIGISDGQRNDDEATRLDHLPRFRRWRRRGAPPGGKQSDFSRSRWLAGRLAPSTNDQASALQMRRVSASMLSCWSRRSCESGSPMRRRQSSGRRDRRRRTAETSSKSRDENLPLDSRIAARASSVSHSKVAHERVATARGLGLGRSFNPLPWLPRGESGEASPR
jgi:hypothetical protein